MKKKNSLTENFLLALLGMLLFPSMQAAEKPSVVQDTLTNGQHGPEMILIPQGSFLMGSNAQEAGRYPDEGPQHEVIFKKAFLLGKTEVTVGQFRVFVEATGYQTDAETSGGSYLREPIAGNWQLVDGVNWRTDHTGKPSQDTNPVVHISWHDAKAYVQWLSQQSGKHYRLPSESEIEYANRAGSSTLYWWGNTSPPQNTANVKGDKDVAVANPHTWEHTPSEYFYAIREGETPLIFENYGDNFHGLAPVGSMSPNPFGLYDTTGNVWEWVEDCWHDNYEGAPNDGSAWVDDSCQERIVRGGSFYCYPRHVRSANRWRRYPEFRNMYVGFRVARDL